MTSLTPFIHRKIVVLTEDAPIHQAARAMCDRGIGCVVVGDHHGHIVGILTDRDLVCGLLANTGAINGEVMIGDVMTPNPAFVSEEAQLEEAVTLMESYGIRRVPVVNRVEGQKDQCIGLVSLDDLIASQAIDYDHVSKVVQAQIGKAGSLLAAHPESGKAESRSHAHLEQTYHRFVNTISDKVGISKETSETLMRVMFSSLVQRIHYSVAAHLISQLPGILQEDLLDLPAGPNRKITRESIFQKINAEFGWDDEKIQAVVGRFSHALRELMDGALLDHVYAQLPGDIRTVFEPQAVVEKPKSPLKAA